MSVSPAPGYATHEVLNQAGALADYDAYGDDSHFAHGCGVTGLRRWLSRGLTE
jgi:hypothetical protein